jgi:hypothetical protein
MRQTSRPVPGTPGKAEGGVMTSGYRNGCCSARNPCPKHREIARRYRRNAMPFVLDVDRFEELIRLAHDRHGDMLPDDEQGRLFAFVMAHHLGEPDSIRAYLDSAAPWWDEADALIKSVTKKRLRWRADTLASTKWLAVSYGERQRLGLKTIGAHDIPKKLRTALRRRRYRARRRALDRAWRQQQRRRQGAKPRAQYEAESVSQTKPWLAAGVSRATWYRNRETSASCTYTYYTRERRTCLTPSKPLAPDHHADDHLSATALPDRSHLPLHWKPCQPSNGRVVVSDRLATPSERLGFMSSQTASPLAFTTQES